jgi:hypothetical protein
MNSKSLHVQMQTLIDKLIKFNEINVTDCEYKQLIKISPATIDRLLSPIRKRYRLKGISTTKPGELLKNSIKIRRACDEMEKQPIL